MTLNILILVLIKVFYSKFFPNSFGMNLIFNSNILSNWITVKQFFSRQCFSISFSDYPCIHMNTPFPSIKINYWCHMYKICIYSQTCSNYLLCKTTSCLRQHWVCPSEFPCNCYCIKQTSLRRPGTTLFVP